MRYFKDEELTCNCGCGFDVHEEVKELLDRARQIAGIPFVITSGARCSRHNESIGGSNTSSHMKGLAVDIAATSAQDRGIITHALYEVGFRRFGHNFDKKFVHVDFDKTKVEPAIFGY